MDQPEGSAQEISPETAQPPWRGDQRPWEEGRPPWMNHGESGHWRSGRWGDEWHAKRRFLFLRFLGVFGVILLLTLGGMGMLAYLLTRWFGGDGHMAVMVWLGGCGLAFGLPLLGVTFAVRAFRRRTRAASAPPVRPASRPGAASGG